MSLSAFLVVSGKSAGFIVALLTQGISVQSTLQILLVNLKEGNAKKPPHAPYRIAEAHCVLIDMNGNPSAVGVLNVPKALIDIAKPGTYTASFGLEAATYGDNQGKIVATLAGLTPLPPKSLGAPKV